MRIAPGISEAEILTDLQADAERSFGQERAGEIGTRLKAMAHWIWMVTQQPLDLLDEEPDLGR